MHSSCLGGFKMFINLGTDKKHKSLKSEMVNKSLPPYDISR